MAKNDTHTLSKLEGALLTTLKSLDNQMAREMQRSPEQLEKLGVQKWEPISKRVELITGFLLDRIGDDDIKIESLLVLLQSLSKTLYLLSDELQSDGLGKIRAEYILDTSQKVSYDVKRIVEIVKGLIVS